LPRRKRVRNIAGKGGVASNANALCPKSGRLWKFQLNAHMPKKAKLSQVHNKLKGRF